MCWDGEERSFQRRGRGQWVLEKGERREGSRGERGGGGLRTIFSRRTMHENGRRRGGQRLENGAERLALVVRGACGFEDASIGGDETLEHRTVVSVVIRLGKSQAVPWLQGAGQTGEAEPSGRRAVDGKVHEANASRPFAPSSPVAGREEAVWMRGGS